MSRRTTRGFAHLHVHTEFSRLDGMSHSKDLARLAAEDNNVGLSFTDHGAMGAIVQLFKATAGTNVTPVPGFEAYHVNDLSKMRQKDASSGKSRFHMILLATSTKGYHNLLKLSSAANIDNFFRYPLSDDEALAKYAEGVVATSGCLGSRVNQALVAGKYDLALEYAGRHQDIYGRDNYFIEVQNHGIKDQLKILPLQLKLAKDLGAPLLATNDSHYTHAHDASAHEALLALGTGTTMKDPDRFHFEGTGHHFRTEAEMRRLFPDDEFPGACDNTAEIAERAQGIDIGLSIKRDEKSGEVKVKAAAYLIPTFPLPDEHESEQDYLRDMVMKGAAERYADDRGHISVEILERIEYELGVIHSMGFDGYFLIVADIVRWAKGQGIGVGPGRGSAAGSVVSYCTKITNIDPIHYKLYFERFLNPGRKSMPDIDLDFEPSRRSEVQHYIASRYPGMTARIATYGVYKPKSAIQAAARVLALPVSVGQQLSGMWPGVINQKELSLAKTLESTPPQKDGADDPSWLDNWRAAGNLRKARKADKTYDEVLDLAVRIEGVSNQNGIHAGGILITPGQLTDYVPLHLSRENDGIPVAAYSLYDTEAIGGLKMDLLGLMNLSIIGRAVDLIRTDVGKKIDIDNIPLDDSKVYRMLSDGETDGVFQLESTPMRDTLRRMGRGLQTVEDISSVIALVRPGPMGMKLHQTYADVKNGKTKPKVVHPEMFDLMPETFGQTVYQEQLMLLATHYAGYSGAEGDDFRKAVGKKDAVLLASQESKFKSGAIARGYKPADVDRIWEIIPPFAAYAFNKAHSMSYAMVAYQTAWLKANFPAQYAAACIDYLSPDQVYAQVTKARASGVKVSAPNINSSRDHATTAANHVWLGMGGIKGVGPGALQKILRAQSDGEGEFTSLGDFIRRSGVSRPVTSSLISAGCFDSLHRSRKSMHDNLDSISTIASRMKGKDDSLDIMGGMFGDVMENSSVTGALDEFDLDGPDYEMSDRIRMEIAALGFPVSEHPYSYVEDYLRLGSDTILNGASPVGSIHLNEGEPASVYGTAVDIDVSSGKNNKPRTRFTIETSTGQSLDAVNFGFDAAKLRDGDLVVVHGSLGTYHGRGGEVTEFRVRDLDIMPLDHLVAEVHRLASSTGPKPEQTSSGRGADGKRRARRRDDIHAYVFTLNDQDDSERLLDLLDEYDDGDIEIRIKIGASHRIGVAEYRYDIDESSARRIADKLDARFDLVLS